MKENERDGTGFLPLLRHEIEEPIMEVIENFIGGVPRLPVHIHRLLEIVSDSESDSLEVANAASADPGLVSTILRVVNSSYYGLSNKTDNIHFAIVLLGFDEVRKIALQSSLSGMFVEGKTKDGYETRGLWVHSYLVSVCAEVIGRTKNTKYAGEVLTFGLLHDLGKFGLFKLATYMKEQGISPYRPINDLTDVAIMEKEEALFKVSHPVVGSMLAERFGLSERICKVIEYHHHPLYRPLETVPPEYVNDIATIGIADAIINLMSGKTYLPEPLPVYFEAIGLTPPVENCIDDELREKIDDARKFVSIVG